MSVLVTGANGFIAKHVIYLLLQEEYSVIGTVRSEEKADKLLKQFGGNRNLKIVVVPDLSSTNGLSSLFKNYGDEIETVLHIASPAPSQMTDYERLLVSPAIKSTTNVLQAVRQYGANTVKRLVVTSSALAVSDLSKRDQLHSTYNESDWNSIDENYGKNFWFAYIASKKLSELIAWRFMEDNGDKVGFQLTTILPTCVFGPQRFDEDVLNGLNFSNKIFESIMHSFPGEELTPDLYPEFVDVRDVAKAHLLAFQKRDAINQRLVLNSEKYRSQEIADILNSKFPQLKGKITEGPAPGIGHKNSQSHFDTTKTNNILGIKYTTLEQTVIDTATQVLKGEGWL